MRNRLRWIIVLASFLLSVLLYVDRVCISAAKDEVAEDLKLTDLQMGWVFSAFALGYALMQTPSGWLADRLGPRRVLAMIVTIWSIFTGLTAAASSWISMLAVRFLFGAGEAGAFPGMARAVFSWIPMKERGLVQGINFSGSRIGAAITLPVIALLVHELGWRPTFVLLMVIGFVWAIAWFFAFRDDPTEANWLGDEEREFILNNRQDASDTSNENEISKDGKGSKLDEENDIDSQPTFFGSLIRSRTVAALCGQYFASNFVFFFGLTWFFPDIKERFDLTGVEASLFAAAPMIFGAIGNWTSGFWIDRLYSSENWVLSRRLPAMTGFLLASVGIIGCAYATTPLVASLLFSLCIFGADMTLSPSWSTCVDIGKKHSGVVSGTMNMAGNIGSFVTSIAFPFLVAWTGSDLPFFYVAAALNLFAILLWLTIDPTRSLKD